MTDTKKPMNRIEDPGFEAIKDIGRKYSSRGPLDAQERQRLKQASESVNGLQDLLEAHPELSKSKTIVNGLEENRETMQKLSPRVALRRETHRDRAIRDTMNSVSREFDEKTVNGVVRRSAEGSGAQSRGLSMTGLSQRELEQQRSGIMASIGGLEKQATAAVTNDLYDQEGRQNPETLERLKATYRQKNALTNKAASIDAAMQKKRQEGTDDRSVDRSLFDIGKSAQKTLFKNSIGQELASGEGFGAMSGTQLKQKEAEQAKGLVEALEKLKNSAGESAETIDKMREEAKGMAESLKKTQEAIKQGGGGIDRGELLKGLMQSVPGMLNTAAGAMQESLIAQPMQTLGNRLGFAALSNQQYAQRNSAINGNMTDLLNSTMQSGSKMSEIGKNFSDNAEIVRGTNLVAGAVTTGLGAAQAIKGTGQQLNPFAEVMGNAQVSEITSGVNTAISGAAQTATAATDLINQSSASSANLGGQQVGMALNNEVNKVRGDFRQSFYDYSQGTRNAALAAGGAGGQRLMNEFAADRGGANGRLGQMQKARIAPNEFARLEGEGAAEQGSVFNSQEVFRARALERSGVGSIDTNMQRMSTLAAAGANNPQAALSSVMEAAFSKGLDSSKALNMMVQNTGELVKSSAGASMLGLDTTKSASERLAALVNPNMPNREAAAGRAMTAEAKLNDINSSTGVNFSDMLTTTRMARTAGVNSVTAIHLKQLDNSTADALQAQLADYQKMDPNSKQGKSTAKNLESILFKAGAGQLVNDDGSIRAKEASEALRIRGMSALGSGSFLNLVDPNVKGYDQFQSGKLSAEQIKTDPQFRKLRQQVSSAAANIGLTEDEVYAQAQRANGKSPVTAGAKAKVNQLNAGQGGSQSFRDADDAATAGGADMANKARLAAKELGGAAEALGKINKQIQSLVGNLNDKTSGSFQNASADAAKNLDNSANIFFNASKSFKDSVDVFSKIPTSTGQAIKDALKPIVDRITQVGGGSDNKQKSGPK